MPLSEQVAKLEEENTKLRAGWRDDLAILVALAERHGEAATAQAAKVCLTRL